MNLVPWQYKMIFWIIVTTEIIFCNMTEQDLKWVFFFYAGLLHLLI